MLSKLRLFLDWGITFTEPYALEQHAQREVKYAGSRELRSCLLYTSVPVLVWKIKPSDERALDLYEGHPHLYRKENLSVTMDSGEQDIMAYVMTGEREYGVPARSYYETIARGYADAGFDIGCLLYTSRCV